MVKSLWLARKNMLAAWPKSYYRRELIVENCFGRRLFIVNNPAAVLWVMVTNSKNYRKSPANSQTLKPLLGNGLFVSEGELWTRQRHVANPSTATQRLGGYARTIVKTGQEMLEDWKSRGPSFEADVTEPFTLVAAEIISRIMFNYPLGEKGLVLFQAFKDYQASHGRVHVMEFLSLPAWLPRPGRRKGRRAVEKFDSVLLEIIRTGRERGPQEIDDLLQMLISFRDDEGNPMDPALVRDEVASIFLAGHETTALTLTWAFYLLDRHPDAETRLHEELERVLGGRAPAFEDVGNLVFTRAIIEETLRLYPPVHVFSRQAVGADEIGGQRVPPGSFILISSWLLHRHKLYWENPEAFNPDRFLAANAQKIERYAYIPFGAGPRICLGKHLGLLEAVLMLAMVAQSFRMRVREGYRAEPVARMTLRPSEGMPMRIERRTS